MGFIFIILGSLMWSIDTLIRYPLLAAVRPQTIVFIEHLILVLCLLPLFFLKKASVQKYKPSSLPSFFVIGVIGSALSTLAFTSAFSLINPSLVILLQKLQPILVIFLSAIVLKEKITPRFYFFAAIAIVGGFMISYPDLAPLLQAIDSGTDVMLGYALTLMAVAGWAASTVYGKKLGSEGFNEIEIMAGRFSFGFVALFLYAMATGSLPGADVSGINYLKVLVMVLISGLLGMYLYYKGLK